MQIKLQNYCAKKYFDYVFKFLFTVNDVILKG